MEDFWLKHAKRLQALASTGAHFGDDPYHQERYGEIATIAHELLGALGGVPLTAVAGAFDDFGSSYATPKVDVRGAVFDGDRILLVQERSDGLWTLPGGYADVGLSPAENVVKEIQEEAGLSCRAARLFALRHKARHGYTPDARDFYKLFFLCECDGPAEPRAGLETQAAAFFERAALPALSQGRVITADIDEAYRARDNPLHVPVFD